MCLIILLPESELHILGYFFHYIIGHNTENLISGRIQRKLISIFLQCSLDLLCSFHCRFADPQVQSVRKQLTKLDPGDSSFGKQCSMLLDDRKEMRNPSFLRYNHRFSKQCSAFGSSNVKRITKFSQISESHIVLRTCQCIGKAGAIHIKGKMIFPADFAESC